MVRVSSPAKLRAWSELTAQNGDGGGSCVDDRYLPPLTCWKPKMSFSSQLGVAFREKTCIVLTMFRKGNVSTCHVATAAKVKGN